MTDAIRVLHVDDDPTFADLAATFLRKHDEQFSIETATSAAEGLEYLAEHDVDCVVSDYDMPSLDGIEFLERVRERHPELPFVLYTGKGSEAVASDAISAGVTEYLQKETGTSHYEILANRVRNVVEQYRTRQAVEDAEERLSVIADKSEDVLFMFDADWNELQFVNAAYEEIWDGAIAELEEDPRSFMEYVHPDDREDLLASMERISNGASETVEYRLLQADGDPRWVRGDTKPIFDETGAVTSIVGYVRDVTEQKERERELERITDRYQSLVENGSDVTTVLDESGVIQYESSAAERVLGYDPEELVGERAFEYVHPEDRDRVWERFVEIVDQRSTTNGRLEYRFRHADGSWVWLETTGSNRTDSATEGYVLTSRGITERREREQRLRALNEASTSLVAAGSRKRVAEIGVESAKEILGLEANGIHLYDADADGLVPVAQTEQGRELVEEQPTFTEQDSIAWRVYQAGEARAIDDVREQPDVYDGETAIKSELFLPIGDHGILIAAAESTDTFDEGDLVLGEILANTVAAALDQVDRTRQLADRERTLRQQNDRLEEFASVVSHDLQNPLQVAQGRVDLAREDGDLEHLEDAAKALERMQTLIGDLLALSREGERIGEREPVDLGRLAEQCWTNVDHDDATLRVDVDASIDADESRIRQLLENLFQNAIQHAGDDVTVTVGRLEDGFYVEDDGPGIPEADRDDVFDTSYSQSAEGSGLGLSIVEEVASAHGWTVRVVEGADGGARFEVTGIAFEDG